MSILSQEQEERALDALQEYLKAAPSEDGKAPREMNIELDQNRHEVIQQKLRPLLQSFLNGKKPLSEFKTVVDGLNKRFEYWGFRGIKGQMFFNMLFNAAGDLSECEEELKSALGEPSSEEMARSKIRNFQSYVRRVGEDVIDRGGSKQLRPKVSSIPFFLSYFWQIQDPRGWPVYYTNTVNTLSDFNLWQPSDDLAADYVSYKRLHKELAELFSRESESDFGLYEVEHVFWFHGGNPRGGSTHVTTKEEDIAGPGMDQGVTLLGPSGRLPESYVPPIIAILPEMARHSPELEKAALSSGTSLERAFEKSVNAAYTILGYETRLLGQGQGRVPDGVAIDIDNGYAIIWDAKVREDQYSMGTDDRIIREYIFTQTRDLKRKRSLRNIYYVIVSSRFADDYEEPIKTMKMETDINEVCLFEAEALVAIVEAKLRTPLQLSLGSDGIQRLFSSSGVISAEVVRSQLM